MRKLWIVAAENYSRVVLTRGFILAVLSLPLFIALMLWLISFVVARENDNRPVGYVDPSGLLANAVPGPVRAGEERVALLPYQTEEKARKALEDGEIQSYYVLPQDYPRTRQVEAFFKTTPGSNATRQFWDFVRANLIADLGPAVRDRAAAGAEVVFRLPDGSRQFRDNAGLVDVLPFFAVLFSFWGLIFVLIMSPGQPMLAVAREKENRTVEVLMTSLSTGQLVGGKIVGIVGVAATLVVGWAAVVAASVVAAAVLFDQAWLRQVRIEPLIPITMVALYALAYVMMTALLAALGATVVEAREGGAILGALSVPMMLPFYLLQPILENPDGPLAVAMSLIPFTAPATLPLRLYLMPVPVWEIALSLAILGTCAVGAIWLAGRAFRLGMLRYGQRLSLRELAGRTRSSGLVGAER